MLCSQVDFHEPAVLELLVAGDGEEVRLQQHSSASGDQTAPARRFGLDRAQRRQPPSPNSLVQVDVQLRDGQGVAHEQRRRLAEAPPRPVLGQNPLPDWPHGVDVRRRPGPDPADPPGQPHQQPLADQSLQRPAGGASGRQRRGVLLGHQEVQPLELAGGRQPQLADAAHDGPVTLGELAAQRGQLALPLP